ADDRARGSRGRAPPGERGGGGRRGPAECLARAARRGAGPGSPGALPRGRAAFGKIGNYMSDSANLTSGALRRPVTVIALVLAVALLAGLTLARMPVDIFPNLNLPVIYVAQPYGGMDPAQMEGFVTYYYEYHFLYITGIEHVESKSIQNVALLKI